jgi:hypothetical protein
MGTSGYAKNTHSDDVEYVRLAHFYGLLAFYSLYGRKSGFDHIDTTSVLTSAMFAIPEVTPVTTNLLDTITVHNLHFLLIAYVGNDFCFVVYQTQTRFGDRHHCLFHQL